MTQRHIQHLYWRAGFGATPKQTELLSKMGRSEVVDMLFKDASSMTMLETDTSEIDHLTLSSLKVNSNRKLFSDVSTKKLKDLNILWVTHLANTEELIREKMTLFWANHFVCRDTNIFHVQQYNNTLRAHAIGDFGHFVKAISKEASMLKYLNNKQNRKLKPNENFARELMELFMLGEGHYNENDVKESARAFTGYNHDFEGDFIRLQQQHDEGFKTFFGHTGRYDGDDIIDIILEQRQCARHICQKIYRYFVNDTVSDTRVEELTDIFYKDYNIETLMRYLFSADWFYDEEHIGAKIKSPIEFLVGMVKTVPVTFKTPRDLLKIQKLLGQILLNPPNVAGWEGGRSWIDSNTIMMRLKLPSIILGNARIPLIEKGEFEDSFKAYYRKRIDNFVTVEVDWETFESEYESISVNDLKSQLIVSKLNDGTETYLRTLSKTSKRDVCIQLMSLPEYQMS